MKGRIDRETPRTRCRRLAAEKKLPNAHGEPTAEPARRAVSHPSRKLLWQPASLRLGLLLSPGSLQSGCTAGSGATVINVFVRCGDRYQPPVDGNAWVAVTLPQDLRGEHLADAVAEVRERLRGAREARVLVAGPVVLGVALGQGLAHEPTAIDYVQLNQTTKEFETWLTNRRNL